MTETQLFNPNYEIILKIRDIEESQRLAKERLLLIGENLIESQEKNNKDMTEVKKQLIELKDDLDRIKEKMSSIAEEVSKSARKQEIAILARQFKMFEPLKYARIEDIDKIINEKLNKHNSAKKEDKKEEIAHKFWAGKL